MRERDSFKSKGMKRIGNLYQKIISIENLKLADKRARKGKGYQYGIKVFDQDPDGNLQLLHDMLKHKTYRTSEYTTFLIKDPKEREVFRLPYFPDRITHHAIMVYLEKIFVDTFTRDTYSCIKKRGIHPASYALRDALMTPSENTYCLKLDIRKFYPSINHDVLKMLLRRKIKDQDLLWLLDEIIDSAPGVPIGNYLSQYFANFYLAYFDHWIKEDMHIRYYFRYADDLVLLSDHKADLHQLLDDIRVYLGKLHLKIKDNYQVFPVLARGIDFVGYVHYPGYTKLRPRIKKRFARMLARAPRIESIASYYGWAAKADCSHLLKKLLSNGTNQILQGPRRHHNRIQSNDRASCRYQPAVRPGDHSSFYNHRALQASREGKREVPVDANFGERRQASSVLRFPVPAGTSQANSPGGIPVLDSDHEEG